jgi:hypothetical protein
MHRRPVFVTIFAILVLILTVWNGVRCYGALTSWGLLVEMGSHPGPLYIAMTGLAWAAGGMVLFLGLWRGRKWAPTAGWVYILLYLGFFWADRLLFRPSERAENYLLLLLLQLGFVGLTYLALARSSSKTFFR